MNYIIDADEVVLYQGKVGYQKSNKTIDFVLTSKKMVFEQTKGVLKKENVLIDIVNLDTIKIYNEVVQVKQKLNEIQIQTVDKNFSIYLSNPIDARKVVTKIINTVTSTTVAKRGAEKVKSAIDLVDDTLGLDTRGMVKGVVENGFKGSLINGIKKKK